MSVNIPINNIPDANELWSGIGGHFDSLGQILCEFIDNSISNFTANKLISKTIIITLKELKGKKVLVSVEDSGTGIKNMNSAFTLGSKAALESPLNEHGFGMKHALASANIDNDNWKIYTRTKEDFDNKQFKKINSPYKLNDFGASLVQNNEEQWAGQLNGPGTFVEFKCSYDLYKTIRKGVPGNYSFGGIVDILVEDLGFIYSGLIKENKATITILYEDIKGNTDIKSVSSIEPDWEQFFDPRKGETKIDLGGGTVTLKYAFGAIKESKNYKYYKRNMSSSGVEIRINGRVLAYNLFKEIWGIERHNKYNYLLISIDVISDDRSALPTTRTSKNGIREGDEKLEKLYKWIREYLHTPKGNIADVDDEDDLFEKLEDIKNKQLPDPKIVNRQQSVYRNIKENVRIDLYVKTSDNVVIYEGKKDKTTIKDLYQLKMYWDGCVLDGIQPTKAILISSYHPNSVIDLAKYINQMRDLKGGHYKFETKMWRNESVEYPPFSDK
jgi:hypothetical protein